MYEYFQEAKSEKILYEFQRQALATASHNYFYALDTGTGKTITSIHHYLKYSQGEPLIIFAPAQKVKEGGWDRDIKFVSTYYGIQINYEVISYGMLAKTPIPNHQYSVIFDEAHYIKNPTSKRGKQGAKFANQAINFVLLTATPMSNGWEDSYNYFIMFKRFRNKTHMNREHAIYEQRNFGARTVNIITGWKNERLLKRYFEQFSVSISKDDALDLPPLVIRPVYFKSSPVYKKLKKDRVLDDVAYDSIPKLIHGLRFYANQKDKLNHIEMMFEGTKRNIVIFYQYQKEYEELHRIAIEQQKQIYLVNGQRSKLPDRDEWDKLTNSVTLVQYQAGSSGIELQYCSEVVFYTPTYSYQDYEQALGRAYRNGQTKKVTVYQFKTEGTIEEDVWQALSNKKDFSAEIYALTKLGGK